MQADRHDDGAEDQADDAAEEADERGLDDQLADDPRPAPAGRAADDHRAVGGARARARSLRSRLRAGCAPSGPLAAPA